MKAKTKKEAISQNEIIKEYNSGIPFIDNDEWSFLDWIPIDRKWHHIAIVHTEKSEKKYVNGQLVHETVFNELKK